MPRFFFDVDDGVIQTRDEEGVELPDARHAGAAGVAVLPALAREFPPDGDRRVFVCKVRDWRNRVVFIATLSLVAEWTFGGPDGAD